MNACKSVVTSDEVRCREILKARARALARPIAQAPAGGEFMTVVEFRLARERYAFEQRYVREVSPLEALTPLPCVPRHVLGVVNLRGQILPVVDIKRLFDLPEIGIADLHMVIVVRWDDIELGILADSIIGAGEIAIKSLQIALPTLPDIGARYLKGITPDHVIVLDARRILEDPRLLVNEEVNT